MTSPMALRPPVAGLCTNPLAGLLSRDMAVVPFGTRIADIAPPVRGPLVCRLNGEWILREYWDHRLVQCDVLEFYEMPQGGSTLRTVLTIAVLVASVWTGGAAGAAYFGLTAGEAAIAGIAVSIVGNLLINAAFPLRQQGADAGAAAGGAYSTSLAGNAARLDQPIWKVCGRVKVTPPFAATPYYRYVPSDPLNPTVDCDQYYYALFVVGVGEHELEKVFIGKTSISHFRDVTTARYLAPGEQPTVVGANVVTSEEVAGLALDVQGEYAGGYAACRPADKVTEISIDVIAPQGLGDGNDDLTVEWQVEIREINDFGAPSGEWQVVATESRRASTNTPQRWTNDYVLSAPIRCEVRLARLNEKNTSASVRDGIQWAGLRGVLQRQAALDPSTAHYEVVMRASEQLSGASQRDFSMIVRARVRTWTPEDGWGPETFSRNAADWLIDLWASETWGEGYPDSRIDLQGIYEWGQTLAARQDHFDFAFTQSMDAWEAATLIAHVGRARPFIRNGVRTVARDELQDIPVTAFTSRNTQPKSMKMHSALPQREQADGIVVEYTSNITWDTATIECPCPGFSVSDDEDPRFDPDLPPMASPVYIKLDGITGAIHAEREGLYQAANMALRRTTVSCTVEMEGAVVPFMAPVRWQPQLRGYGQAGDVATWNPGTLVMGLTEPPEWGDAPLYLTLQRDDLSLTTPVAVAPGPTAWDVTLPAAPDFMLVLDDGTRERPRYLLGPLETGDELVKLVAVTDAGRADGGAQLYEVAGLIDDDRVHAADNHLLPGPGDVQDPIDDGGDVDEAGGGMAAIVALYDEAIQGGYPGAGPSRGGSASYTLHADGTAGWRHVDDHADPSGHTVSGIYSGAWLTSAPVEPAVAAAYEVYADDLGSFAQAHDLFGATTTGTIGAWLPLSENHTWSLDADDTAPMGITSISVVVKLSIRRIGTTLVQARRQVSLTVVVGSETAGGA